MVEVKVKLRVWVDGKEQKLSPMIENFFVKKIEQYERRKVKRSRSSK